METLYDVLIAGGGPAGLSAALALGRARKRVLLCDAGARRNAAAVHLHNFVTRDGATPDEFRRAAREQLAAYPNVTVRDVRIEAISGVRGAFEVRLADGAAQARRVVLCTGMIDEQLPLPGFAELWGRSIFQCPYCHGWEVKEQRWAYLAASAEHLHFPLQLRAWTPDVVVFTSGALEVPAELRGRFEAAGIGVETAPVTRLLAREGRLEAIELASGARVAREVLFAHPPQRQLELVRDLGLALDEEGFVKVDAMTRETSRPGIYAAGDLTTRLQAAIIAAGQGMQAAAVLNFELTTELATSGAP
jgi:thioredoxin reductase